MLSAVIVDDEIPVLNLLKMFLQKTGQVNIVGTFISPKEALKNIINIKPDVVFLDIEVPGMNGLELANHLIEQNDELIIVFVTGYNQYALEAFEVNALDYILKPVNPSRIQKCISRLMKLKAPRNEKDVNIIEQRICCFGDFEVYGNKGLIKWPTRKVEEVFAYCIVHRDFNIEGWELGEILWPGADPEKIKTNLHTSFFRLRKTIKENGLNIEINSKKAGKGGYRCDLMNFNCDLVDFENAILENKTVNKDNIHEFEGICSLYKDDLFSKRNYEWCEVEREHLLRYYIKMLKKMAVFYVEEGLYEDAINKLFMAKEKSQFDEEVHKMILRIYFIQKNKALLIKCHKEFKLKLRNEMDIEPHEQTNKLFLKLLEEI